MKFSQHELPTTCLEIHIKYMVSIGSSGCYNSDRWRASQHAGNWPRVCSTLRNLQNEQRWKNGWAGINGRLHLLKSNRKVYGCGNYRMMPARPSSKGRMTTMSSVRKWRKGDAKWLFWLCSSGKKEKITVLGLNFWLCIEVAALAASRTKRNFVSNVHLFERRHKLVDCRTFRSLKFMAQNTKL